MKIKPFKYKPGDIVQTMYGTGVVGDDNDIHLNGIFILNGKTRTIGNWKEAHRITDNKKCVLN